jgi:hypothetical protein
MPQTLLDIVTGLEPELRRRLSQGSVDFANGEAAVRLSFLLFTAIQMDLQDPRGKRPGTHRLD